MHTTSSSGAGGREINHHPGFVGETSSKPAPKSPQRKKGAKAAMGKQSEPVPVKQGRVAPRKQGKGKAAPAAGSKAFAAAPAAPAAGMELALKHKFAARKQFDFANRGGAVTTS
jgi:hypothetical protein